MFNAFEAVVQPTWPSPGANSAHYLRSAPFPWSADATNTPPLPQDVRCISSTPLLVVFVQDSAWAFVLTFGESSMNHDAVCSSRIHRPHCDSGTAVDVLTFETVVPMGNTAVM